MSGDLKAAREKLDALTERRGPAATTCATCHGKGAQQVFSADDQEWVPCHCRPYVDPTPAELVEVLRGAGAMAEGPDHWGHYCVTYEAIGPSTKHPAVHYTGGLMRYIGPLTLRAVGAVLTLMEEAKG